MNIFELLFFIVNVTVGVIVGQFVAEQTHWSLGLVAGIGAFGGMIGLWAGLNYLDGWLCKRRKRN